jgi:hypothetical protein
LNKWHLKDNTTLTAWFQMWHSCVLAIKHRIWFIGCIPTTE